MATNWYIYVHNTNNYLDMWKFFAEHTATFWRAVYGTTPVWCVALFIITPNVTDLLFIIFKVMYAIVLGFATALGKLLCDYWVAKYKSKRDVKKQNRKNKAA
jgi:hypothetical protein